MEHNYIYKVQKVHYFGGVSFRTVTERRRQMEDLQKLLK